MKRNDLAGAVHGAARPAAAPTPTHAPPGNPGPGISPSRAGKRGILIYVEPELGRRLKILAAQHDTTLQTIGVEAFEQLLAKSGDPR